MKTTPKSIDPGSDVLHWNCAALRTPGTQPALPMSFARKPRLCPDSGEDRPRGQPDDEVRMEKHQVQGLSPSLVTITKGRPPPSPQCTEYLYLPAGEGRTALCRRKAGP